MSCTRYESSDVPTSEVGLSCARHGSNLCWMSSPAPAMSHTSAIGTRTQRSSQRLTTFLGDSLNATAKYSRTAREDGH